ncbi:PIN domain-containing protein [Thermus brockianus]|jgi:predicted nucleic acid-binding protein|uniref:tRNA(fMet)-specific endonuclease VapC n=1 Tax=Thermus brockianus TaxID=56956 RepID=A0A1J0LWD7_THEBO|nr:PIN domain-containing protein [Thermus brockianus]APD10450.1 tRNA(fMet)-specific endonuclease VapC [Thermus brockianus]
MPLRKRSGPALPPSPAKLRRLFLDANVLFAACWQSGRARALSELAPKVGLELLTSAHALEEAQRNLEAKRLEALEYLQVLRESVRLVPEAPWGLVQRALAKDLPLENAPILAAAWSAGADALVTGDRRHFGHLMGKKVGTVWVLSLGEALGLVLDLLESQG